MDWRAIRQHLLNAKGFDLDIQGAFGQSKTIHLTMWPNSPHMLKFKTLGSGSMKRVVKVEGEEWALALAGDSPAARQDMQGEVKTLLALAKDGVRVPEPFATGNEGEILFDLTVTNNDSGDQKAYPAFLQQFLPYQEMDKLKAREDFAKDFVVKGAVPPNIGTTIEDLKRILTRLRKREWGDFQVMYDKATGRVYVFDPLPENNSGQSAVPLVKRWLADIETAKAQTHRWIQPMLTATGAHEV